MKNQTLFSFDRFSSLTGSDLVNYVEPYLSTRPEAIPESVYGQLLSGLATWDEYHVVYAMELCMRSKPEDFVGRAVPFLSHRDASVCCTAYRLIKSLPPSQQPDDLVSEIASVPVVELFRGDPRSGELKKVGTNEAFLLDLLGHAPLNRGRSAIV